MFFQYPLLNFKIQAGCFADIKTIEQRQHDLSFVIYRNIMYNVDTNIMLLLILLIIRSNTVTFSK